MIMSSATNMELQQTIKNHRDYLMNEMDVSDSFIANLCAENLMKIREIPRILGYAKVQDAKADILGSLEKQNDSGSFEFFLKALEKSGQLELAAKITTIDREKMFLDKWQMRLGDCASITKKYMEAQERRVKVYDESEPTTENSIQESIEERKTLRVLYNAALDSVSLLLRTKTILEKLSGERTAMAHKGADMISRLRDIEAMARQAVLKEDASRTRTPGKSITDEMEELLQSLRSIVLKQQSVLEKLKSESDRGKLSVERIIDVIKDRRDLLERVGAPAPVIQTPRKEIRITKKRADSLDQQLKDDQIHDSTLLEEIDELEHELQEYVAADRKVVNKLHAFIISSRLSRSENEVSENEAAVFEQMKNANKETLEMVLKDTITKFDLERKETRVRLEEMIAILNKRLESYEQQDPKTRKKEKKKEKEDKRAIELPKRSEEALNLVKQLGMGERDSFQLERAYFSRMKLHYTAEQRKLKELIERHESKVSSIESERDKYKTMYEKEKIVSLSPQMKRRQMLPPPAESSNDKSKNKK